MLNQMVEVQMKHLLDVVEVMLLTNEIVVV
jgi:hypothetical protein